MSTVTVVDAVALVVLVVLCVPICYVFLSLSAASREHDGLNSLQFIVRRFRKPRWRSTVSSWLTRNTQEIRDVLRVKSPDAYRDLVRGLLAVLADPTQEYSWREHVATVLGSLEEPTAILPLASFIAVLRGPLKRNRAAESLVDLMNKRTAEDNRQVATLMLTPIQGALRCGEFPGPALWVLDQIASGWRQTSIAQELVAPLMYRFLRDSRVGEEARQILEGREPLKEYVQEYNCRDCRD